MLTMTRVTPSRPPQAGRCPARRRGRGATILEMALTLMVLLYLTFGSIEFGYFFFVKNTVQGAAREGARAGITPSGSNSDVTAAVNNALTAAGLNTGNFTTTVKVNGTVANANTATAGQSVEVSVQGTWGVVGLRPLGLIGTSKNVRGAAAMRKEG
jgi:Flp pilus assembly protein TadG